MIIRSTSSLLVWLGTGDCRPSQGAKIVLWDDLVLMDLFALFRRPLLGKDFMPIDQSATYIPRSEFFR